MNLQDRFDAKWVLALDTGCWEWIGARLPTGYGRFRVSVPVRRLVPAHRLAYELYIGPVTEGKVLDHLCRNRRCVNPWHLEPVTNRENLLRGVSQSAENARKTHCKQGHEFTDENTYRSNGQRMCRACRKAYSHSRTKGALPAKLRTHCPAGHEYSEKNTRVARGQRTCRECERQRSRARRAQDRTAVG